MSEKTARASAGGTRALANASADRTPPEQTKSARLFTEKRDPFKLPPPPDKGKEDQSRGALPPGRRGLIIGQLRLEGVVCEDAGHSMIAVVTNQTNLAYFLRVHDEVYNGVVSVITENSIRFSEKRLDNNGRLETREIVLKLGSPAREER